MPRGFFRRVFFLGGYPKCKDKSDLMQITAKELEIIVRGAIPEGPLSPKSSKVVK